MESFATLSGQKLDDPETTTDLVDGTLVVSIEEASMGGVGTTGSQPVVERPCPSSVGYRSDLEKLAPEVGGWLSGGAAQCTGQEVAKALEEELEGFKELSFMQTRAWQL